MNKFMFLVTHGLKKKLKSKAFIISNIILFVLLIAVTNVDTIINFFGGDFNDSFNIYVIDDAGCFETFKSNYENINSDIDNRQVEIINSNKDRKELQDEIDDSDDIIVELLQDREYYLTASIISDGYIDTLIYQSIVQSINNTKYTLALSNSNIDKEELMKIENGKYRALYEMQFKKQLQTV